LKITPPANRQRVLIVSPHFPPINAPDLQRARLSLPYYRTFGWEPVVLTVDDHYQNGVREPELLQTIPPGTEVHRSKAFSLAWTRRLGVTNLGLRAWPHLFFMGWCLIRRRQIDLVFFTNTQFVTFALGRCWLRLCGVPYVLDVQDPWRTNYYERAGSRRPPGGRKYLFARAMARLLEGWSFRRAAGVISVSPNYLEDLRARYPWFQRIPSAVIGFGASREDLALAAVRPPPAYRYHKESGERHFVYTGASGPVMPHALTVLFDGLRHYRERSPEKARRLRFHFLGTSYVAPGQGEYSVLPLAEQCGVADQVAEVPHRLGHIDCLRLQRDADVLLLPGSSDLAYSPSKLYPYYLADRPILALVFKESVMEKLLDDLDCAVLVRFRENGPKDAAHEALAGFFDLALAGFPPGSLPGRNDACFNRHYLAETLARAQCDLFARAVDSRHD
jgi:glycosyltransferase involved in cell wall biosynthesis